MTSPGTVEGAGQKLADVVRTLSRVQGNTRAASQLLALLGWSLPSGVDDIGLTQLDVANVAAQLDVLTELRSRENASELEIAAAVAGVLDALAQSLNHLEQISASLQAMPEYLSATDIVDQFFPRLADLVIIQLVGSAAPVVVPGGVLLGVFELTLMPADASIFQVQHVRQVVRWDRLSSLLTDPADVLRDVYGWGMPDFQGNALVGNIARLVEHFADHVALRPLPRAVEEQLSGQAVPQADDDPGAQLFVSLAKGLGEGAHDVGLSLYPLRASTPGGSDGGLGVSPYVRNTASTRLSLSSTLALELSASADVQGGLALVLRAGRNPELFTGLNEAPGSGPPAASFAFVLRHAASPGERHVLFSAPGLFVDAAAVTAGVGVTAGASLNPSLFAGIEDGHIRVVPDQADGFLASILPTDGITTTVNLDVSWSHRDGIRIHGGVGLRTSIVLHLTAGPLHLNTLNLALEPAADSIALAATLTGAVSLGPFVATVDGVGTAAELRFERGNLGPIDLDFRFKPPNGIGLAIDAPAVVGGGYLFFDPQKEEYSGMLQLEVAETIAVKAIGLLTTRLPDGSKGFSLVVIISAEGFAPIQLGFGFTLTGIGGVLGVNRTVMVDVLRSGLKNGTLGSILFPADPIRNAPQIVSDLRAVFPPVQDRHVFGPMALISWGTPTILTLEIGLILELPEPVRLIILGRLRAVLPDERTALVHVRMDAIGVIDFNKGEVSLDAILYDSRILQFVLTGDMALRANWGAQPNFVLAIGGLNPRFPAPAGFPQLERLALSLADSDNPRLRFEAYLALTSNTVQFGARLDFSYSAAGFTLAGFLGFDALFQFAPFQFIADVGAMVALKRGNRVLMGLFLDMTLAGPTPWHVWGKATFKVLFFKVSIRFDHRFGRDDPPALPEPIDVLTLLAEALSDQRNWSSALPRGEHPIVSLRDSATTQALRVHPLAELTVRQRVVPLNRPVTKFGHAPLAEGTTTFTVAATGIDNTPLRMPSTMVREAFALAQFQELSNEEKLTQPSFETQDAGLQFGVDEAAYQDDALLDTAIAYETLLIDPTRPLEKVTEPYVLPQTVLDAVVSLGAPGQAVIRRSGLSRYRELELLA